MLAQINGTELFYTTHGRGRPLLLMHGGLGLDHTYFRPWLDALAGEAQLIYYDHRGNGRSARPQSFDGITHDTWIADADALREHLGLERIVLLGHSYGGFLAQQYALRYGDRLDGLILCGTAPAMDYPEVIFANAQARATPAQFELVVNGLSGPTPDDERLREIWGEIASLYFHHYDDERGRAMLERITYSAAAFNHSFFNCLPAFNTLNRLHEISAPTLILAGRHDWITPPTQGAERIHAALKDSKLVVFEDSGHFPFIEEQAGFLSVVAEWLAALSR